MKKILQIKKLFLLISYLFVGILLNNHLSAESQYSYDLNYYVDISPDKKIARVKMHIAESHLVKKIVFNIPKDSYYDLDANGKIIYNGEKIIIRSNDEAEDTDEKTEKPPQVKGFVSGDAHKHDGKKTIEKFAGGKIEWKLPKKDAEFSYSVVLPQEKSSKRSLKKVSKKTVQKKDKQDTGSDKKFSAFINDKWAIFRGDNIVPPATVTTYKRDTPVEAKAFLTVLLPKDWTQVVSGWPKVTKQIYNERWHVSFRINNPERRFDRPVGWFIAGDIGVRKELLSHMNSDKETVLWVAAPKGHNVERMEIVSMLTLIWPQLEKISPLPLDFSVVVAGEPMWRGGLSGPNSLFMHADRPLISENGTSTLLHEVFHSVTRIKGINDDDWIAEGLAEFYSVELLYRAGALTKERKQKTLIKLKDWGKNIVSLKAKQSKAERSARAVAFFDELDREINLLTKGKRNIDDVVRELINIRQVTFDDLKSMTEKIVGKQLSLFDSTLFIPANSVNNN